MADTGRSDADRLRRRWFFAGCIFDEANWTLTVDGRRAQVENKPLELLRHLLMNAGNLVPKDDLLDAIWSNVIVVEASLPTAVRKLRAALGDDARETHIIETVPRIGYRLAVPVTVEMFPPVANGALADLPPRDENDGRAAPVVRRRNLGTRRLLLVTGVLALGIGAAEIPLGSVPEVPAAKAVPVVNQRDAMNALRRLDVDMIERMLAAGWNPNAEMRGDGNAALHYVVEMCEWYPGHDRDRMLLMVRTLEEGGAQLEHRNVWGDTPYSIAKAPRYCGPDHPVTRSIRATCSHDGVVEDGCLASYEIARRRRS